MKKFRKLFSLSTAALLALQVFSVQASPSSQIKTQQLEQKKVLQNMQKKDTGVEQGSVDFQVSWNTEEGIPDFIQGFNSEEKVSTEGDAIEYINNNEALFKIENGKFKVKSSHKDDYGMTHYRVTQEIDGLPLYGKELLIHTSKNNRVYAINGDVQPGGIDSVKWSKYIAITENKSIEKAKESLDIEGLDEKLLDKPTAKKYLYEHEDNWYVVYLVNLIFNEPYPANYMIFVDAEDGSIVDSFNAVADGHEISEGIDSFGNRVSLNTYEQDGVFYLYDSKHPAVIETFTLDNKLNAQQPGVRISSSNNTFYNLGQRAAVDVHHNLAKVYEYYKDKFGRSSFDNNDANIIGSVHYYDQQSGKNNAFWNGRQMLFGDGDGNQFSSFGSALDVVAHEFTHAVTQYTANLEYKDQSGAINESMSDVFGILCEGKEDHWWLVGEDCYTPGKPGDALRDVRNPGAVDQPQPDHMSKYQNVSYDNGGVHINSGIPNKAFYNIASTIEFDKTGKIYYRALTSYLTPKSDFMDLRNAALQSAADIYGADSREYDVVEEGFSKVGLGTISTKDTYEPNNSAREAYSIKSGSIYNSYISSESDLDIYKFDKATSGQINISLSNIDGDFDIYLYNGQGKLVAKSENSEYYDENISYNGGADRYYIKIIGYNGAYSTKTPYRLSVD